MARADIGRVRHNTWKQMKRYRASYLLMAPFMLLFMGLTVLPMLSSVGLSFTSFNMLEPPRFIGWQNYQRMILDDPVFFKVVGNTLLFALITGPAGYIMSFLFAWLIHETGRTLRTILSVIFSMPVLSGNIYFVGAVLLSADSQGVINGWLLQLGIIQEPIGFLIDQNKMLASLMVVQLWMSLGTGFLAFIAGFQSMDKSLFEAGSIDGIGNRWQELWHITLPSMAHQLLFSAVMQISASFGVSAVITTLVGFPTSQYSADTIPTYIMDIGTTRFEMGYACTISVFLFVMMLLTNFAVTGALRRFSPDT